MVDVNKNKWNKVVISGDLFYVFAGKPRKADTMFNKPAMYALELQLTDRSEAWVNDKKVASGVSEIKKALKPYYITFNDKRGNIKDEGGEETGETWERKNVVKFQSQIRDDHPEDSVKRKPSVVDSYGDPHPDNILIGNGSFGRVKGSLPDYTKNAPEAGRRARLPTLDAIQIIELVVYENPEYSPNTFEKVEGGYTVGSVPKEIVKGKTRSTATVEDEEDGGDAFASLGGGAGNDDDSTFGARGETAIEEEVKPVVKKKAVRK